MFFASSELQADREIVLAAVKQNGDALKHAAPDLQADVLFRFASAPSIRQLKKCMTEIRKRAETDNDGTFVEEAINILTTRSDLDAKPTILKEVETFVKKASHPTKGVLGKRQRDEWGQMMDNAPELVVVEAFGELGVLSKTKGKRKCKRGARQQMCA